MSELKLPTEQVTLPSKGLLYPKENPLSSGVIEMKYMTAREEDILTNSNYIRQGTVIDKLLQALIVSPINYDDLLVGDKNAILVAARILGYGKDYAFKYTNKLGQEIETNVDLTTLSDKEIDVSILEANKNEFSFTLPRSQNEITFKLLNHGDEKAIEAETKGLKKIDPTKTYDVTTRMKFIITSIEGKRDLKDIRNFVDNYLLAPDARALREYYNQIQPDINLKFTPEDDNYDGEGIDIPINLNFFWPDAGL
jgi:hypothetical protein